MPEYDVDEMLACLDEFTPEEFTTEDQFPDVRVWAGYGIDLDDIHEDHR